MTNYLVDRVHPTLATVEPGVTPDERNDVRRIAVAYFGGRGTPFTQAEVCELLHCSRWKLNRLRKAGELPAHGAGRGKIFHVEDVYLYLRRHTF